MKKWMIVSLIAASLLMVGCGKKEESQKVSQGQSATPVVKKQEPVSAPEQKADSIAAKVQKVPEQKVEVPAVTDAKALFAKCASCHGPDGKRKALGKSGIIAGMDKGKLLEKLKGYKAGTLDQYGMGALMKAQVAGLSDQQLAALAGYISAMK